MSDLTSEQIRAARMLLRWEQRDLAEASGISLPSVKRLETQPGPLSAQERTLTELRRALEKAGVEFIAENGGGAGVRLAKRAKRNKSFSLGRCVMSKKPSVEHKYHSKKTDLRSRSNIMLWARKRTAKKSL